MKSQHAFPAASTAALAASLGLSRWAVSRALNGRTGVSQETVRRVMRAAEANGFRPSSLARGLRAGQSDVVGICLPDPEAFFLGGKLRALQESLHEQGRQPMLQITDGSMRSEVLALGRFHGMRCSSVVIFASRVARDHRIFQSLKSRGARIVHIDPVLPRGRGAVEADRAAAMILLVGHMVSLGHRRLCLAGMGGANSAYGARRWKGLDSAAKQHGLNPSRAYVMMPARESISDFQLGRELAASYLALGARRPRAILALNDRIAFAMMSCLAVQGLTAPRDYVIAGYDGTELSELCSPALTTIDPGHSELMQSACGLLFSTEPGRTKKISPGLIVRGSTGG